MDERVVEERAEHRVPTLSQLSGVFLASAAALPLTPEGHSFVTLLKAEFSRGVLEGLLMLVGFGSPFLFAVAVAVATRVAPPPVARRLLRLPLAFLHSQLVLVALVVWLAGDAVAELALLGFSLVAGVHLALHTARSHAEGDGPQVAWYVRWGGMMVAAICAWMELQQLGDLTFGFGLHVALGASLLMVASLGRAPLGTAAPARSTQQRPSTLF